MINAYLKTAVLLLLASCACLRAQTPQGRDERPKEAIKVVSFGINTNEYISAMLDSFTADVISRGRDTRGVVVIYGPFREATHRKRVISYYLSRRRLNDNDGKRIDPSFVTIVTGGNVSPLRTDLWVVPKGAAAPVISPEAFVVREFGIVTRQRAILISNELFSEMESLPDHQAYIINYGNLSQVVQREKWIVRSRLFQRRFFDRSRVTFARGGRVTGGPRTVMWLVPPGARNPDL